MQRIIVSSKASRLNENENTTTRNTLDNYIPDRHCCHRCGKEIWADKKASSYKRGITYIHEGRRFDDVIRIPVYLCCQCGKSDRPGGTANGDYYHAILPDTLIPFTCYTLVFVLTVLDDYVRRTRPVAEICSFWLISSSTLYRWKKRYMEHYEAWADSLESIRQYMDHSVESSPEETGTKAIGVSLVRVFHAIASLPSAFFSRFGFSFLQPDCLTHFRPLQIKRRQKIFP